MCRYAPWLPITHFHVSRSLVLVTEMNARYIRGAVVGSAESSVQTRSEINEGGRGGDAKKERSSFADREWERGGGGGRWRSLKDVGRFDVRRPSSCALPHRGCESERMAMHPLDLRTRVGAYMYVRNRDAHVRIRAIARGSWRVEGGVACRGGTPSSIVLDCSHRYSSR